MERKPSFSQSHPLLFGFILIAMAMALFFGAMAFFRGFSSEDGFSFGGSGKIGLVRIEGMIADSQPLTDWMGKLADDPEVKGVLVRVDSPGGLVAPSQEIYRATRSLALAKPVVATMGNVAASGGYYAVAPATVIVANPGSVTGSIGVKAELANFSTLMDKLGIRQELIASGKFKGAGSPLRPLTPEEREYLTVMVMDLHNQFVDDVAKARNMTRTEVEAVADGRGFTGRQALDLKLVDRLGGRDEAVALLKARCGLEGKVPLLEPPKEKRGLVERILGAVGFDPQNAATGPRWVFSYE
jgi:protease-4